MTSTHVRPSGTAVLRSRTARALAALALAVALVPAAPTPARAAVISCPSDEFVVEGFVVFDVTDVTTIADDQDTRDDFYAYIRDDEDWFDGDEAALQSALGSTPEAREAKLTEWLIADLVDELTDEIFRGVGGGRLGAASESPVRVFSTNNLMIGGRQYISALIWTCSPTLVPELTTAIARLGTFEVVTDFAEPDVTCEATVFSPFAHFGVNEIPGTIPDRFYREADGTFAVGANAGDAEDLARASAVAGAGECTIGASSGTTESVTMTLTGTPGFGEDLLVESKVPGTLVGEDFDLWFCPDQTLLPDDDADDNGDCVGPFIQTRAGDSTTFALTLDLLRQDIEDLDAGAVCGLFFIVHDFPGGGHSNWVGPWSCTNAQTSSTSSGVQAIDVDVAVGGPVPTSVPAGDGGLPRGGGLLAMSLALGAAALLSARLGRREATGPTIG